MEPINSMFDVFKIDKADKKNCPKIEYIDKDETMKLLPEGFFERNHYIVNNSGYATVVLGYWRKKDGNNFFEKAYVLSTKGGKGPLILWQHYKTQPYDLLIFYTAEDLNGNPIPFEEDRIKGSLKIDGYFKELVNSDFYSGKLFTQMANELSIQFIKNLRIFQMMKIKKEKPKKKRKYTRKKPSASASAED